VPVPVARPPAPPPVAAPVPPPPAAPATAADFTNAGITVRAGDLPAIQAEAQAVMGRQLTPEIVDSIAGVKGKWANAKVTHRLERVSSWSEDQGIMLITKVEAPDGNSIASLTRRIERTPTGKLKVYNGYFRIADAYKGSGVGRQVIKDQIAAYRALGVERVELTAAWDGQYVWPRMGYRLKNPKDLDGLKAEFVDFLKEKAGYSIAEGVEVARKATDVHELAITVDTKGRKLGNEFLIARGNGDGDMIDLGIDLDDASPDFQRMKTYLAL
jgi:hypothetical protein